MGGADRNPTKVAHRQCHEDGDVNGKTVKLNFGQDSETHLILKNTGHPKVHQGNSLTRMRVRSELAN